jgi:hypothetical protein
VTHATKTEAEAAVAAARERYVRGARTFRLMRVTDPEGNLRVLDFEADRVRTDPAVAELAAAADRRIITRAAAESADGQWRREIRNASHAGVPLRQIALAARTTSAHVPMILRSGA